MFIYLFILVVLLVVLHLAFNYNEKARLIRKLPGPKDNFLIGNLMIPGSPVELMKLAEEFRGKWKNIYRLWSFPFGGIHVSNAEDAEVILSSVKYNDKSLIYNFLHPWLREGLLVSSGEKWQQRRKLLTPAFHFNVLRQYFDVLDENTKRMVEILDKETTGHVDIRPILSEYTLNSVCETAMGTSLSEVTTGTGKSYKEAIYGLGSMVVYRFMRLHFYFDSIFFMSTMGKKMKFFLATVHGFTERVINERRAYVNKHGLEASTEDDDVIAYKKRNKTAMLDLLLLAEKDGLIDSAGIQEEVDTFMFEGHDTTASGLTFCLMELANNKAIQVNNVTDSITSILSRLLMSTVAHGLLQKLEDVCDRSKENIYNELKEIFWDSTRSATMEDLTKMRYLECCIKESLRKYPPVHFISRQLNENVTLSGYTIPSGSMCHINIMDLHRNPDLYKNPVKFDPDRFLPENSVGRHPYSYIPFSAGPRNCIGQKFAMMEMKSAISGILRKFELFPVTRSEDIEFTADLVLKNSRPVYVSFVKR